MEAADDARFILPPLMRHVMRPEHVPGRAARGSKHSQHRDIEQCRVTHQGDCLANSLYLSRGDFHIAGFDYFCHDLGEIAFDDVC
jgi:hypothetical protein